MHSRPRVRTQAQPLVLLAAILLSCVSPARAALTVTPPNTLRGFVLTDYATGFPNSGLPMGIGPIGMAFLPSQAVVITDAWDATLYSLPSHADGQVILAVDAVQTYASSAPFGLAQVQIAGLWHYYTSRAPDLVEIDPTTGNTTLLVPGAGGLGMAPFPAGIPSPYAGHFFVAGGVGPTLWDVDPVAALAAPFVTGNRALADGIAFDASGLHLFRALGDSLFALDVPGGAVAWVGPVHPGEGYDGVAVGLGTLDGYVYVNCNNGDVWEFGVPWGPHPGVDNLLLTGGSRGDFIAVDPNVTSGGFPSLLLTQTDRITRLDPPGGGWFGPPTSSTQPVTSGASVAPPQVGALGTRVIATAPNPTVGSARIDFAVGQEGRVRIGVLDVQGREVAVVADGSFGIGMHQALWDGRTRNGAAPPGVYLVRLQAAGIVSTRTIVLTR